MIRIISNDELFISVLSHLKQSKKRMMFKCNKRANQLFWRVIEAAQTEPLTKGVDMSFLSLIGNIETVTLCSEIVKKITAIARIPCRRAALEDWIVCNDVCIDDGGFYVPNSPDIHFRGCVNQRVRICLWDRAVGLRVEPQPFNVRGPIRMTRYLNGNFIAMGYNTIVFY